jgi:hypothetical protein
MLDDATGVGDVDCAADDEGDAVGEGGTVDAEGDTAGDGDRVMAATVGDAVTEVDEEVGLAWPVFGTTATGRLPDAAKTAAPSATSPAITTIGTSATRLPSGKRSRQLGQKPETGVVV